MSYQFICDPDDCDTFIEVICNEKYGFPSGEVKMNCPCGREMQRIQ
jgi:hypothetical protein